MSANFTITGMQPQHAKIQFFSYNSIKSSEKGALTEAINESLDDNSVILLPGLVSNQESPISSLNKRNLEYIAWDTPEKTKLLTAKQNEQTELYKKYTFIFKQFAYFLDPSSQISDTDLRDNDKFWELLRKVTEMIATKPSHLTGNEYERTRKTLSNIGVSFWDFQYNGARLVKEIAKIQEERRNSLFAIVSSTAQKYPHRKIVVIAETDCITGAEAKFPKVSCVFIPKQTELTALQEKVNRARGMLSKL